MDERNLATIATHHKLKKGSLDVWQLSGLSLSNMAPAYSLFTTLGLVVAGVGFGAPLLFLLAGVATFFHVNTTAEFSRKCPSAGSYTCFISRSFGNYVGITVGIMYLFAWVLLIASVFLVVGTWTQFTIKEILSVNTNWVIVMVVFIGIGTWLCIRGVTLSSRIAISLFLFEVIVLLIGSGFMIFSHVNYISLSPFSFGKLFSNFNGVGLAFPLAIYPFIGSSNAATMAEEAHKPHHSIRIAVFSAITVATVLYVFCVYATIIGSKFDNHILTHATYPMISVAKYALGPYVWLFYVAGLTSTLSLVLVAINAAARVIYNLSKEGVLFKYLSNVHETYRTPYAALLFISIGALGVSVVVGLIFGPINAFNWTGTLGTIPLIVIFVIVNLALPVYFIRNHKKHFSVIFHFAFPILGCLVYLVPLYATVEPGQPAPYNYFGLATLAVTLAGIIYSIYLVNRRFESLNLGLHVALED